MVFLIIFSVITISITDNVYAAWQGVTPDTVIHADSGIKIDYTAFFHPGEQSNFILTQNRGIKTMVEMVHRSNIQPCVIDLYGQNFSRLRCFALAEKLYIYLDTLYCLTPGCSSVEKIELSGDNYRYLNVISGIEDTLLLASSAHTIEVYRIPGFNLLFRIQRSDYLQFDIPLISGYKLVYKDRVNEICIYDLELEKITKRISSGLQPAHFLGIRIGSFEDQISWYHLEGFHLYFTTFSGAIFLVDLEQEEILNHVDRFMGEENNAGLITWFAMKDFNSDGVPDLIGPSVDHNIYCLDGREFTPIWMHNAGYEIQMPLSLYDITKDNIPEVFGVTDAMKLWILDGRDGKPLLEHPISDRFYQSSVGILDFDNDCKPEMVMHRDAQTLEILQLDSMTVDKGEIVWLPLF